MLDNPVSMAEPYLHSTLSIRCIHSRALHAKVAPWLHLHLSSHSHASTSQNSLLSPPHKHKCTLCALTLRTKLNPAFYVYTSHLQALPLPMHLLPPLSVNTSWLHRPVLTLTVCLGDLKEITSFPSAQFLHWKMTKLGQAFGTVVPHQSGWVWVPALALRASFH